MFCIVPNGFDRRPKRAKPHATTTPHPPPPRHPQKNWTKKRHRQNLRPCLNRSKRCSTKTTPPTTMRM
ncbi:Uncharacterized protein TCM_021081 [Theobroma cacao]|uniref:Uncharacterized protein n=1 Tax=Theobroma cacao TaxID=3641 RepID=A0A061ENS5_THECC|nr:Uncharacterized protein TCM_021081 [Theobroma cacao]